MNPSRLAPGPLAIAAALTACGSGPNRGLAGEVGIYDPDGGLLLASDDGGDPGPLDASIERNHIAVTTTA
jgi:hypothetical protein